MWSENTAFLYSITSTSKDSKHKTIDVANIRQIDISKMLVDISIACENSNWLLTPAQKKTLMMINIIIAQSGTINGKQQHAIFLQHGQDESIKKGNRINFWHDLNTYFVSHPEVKNILKPDRDRAPARTPKK